MISKKASISAGTLPNFHLGNYVLDRTFVGFTNLNLQQGEFSHSFGELIGAEILFDHSAIIVSATEHSIYIDYSDASSRARRACRVEVLGQHH